MDDKYRSQGVTVALGNPKINYIEGKVLGGGSEVNSGLYYPPNEKVIDSWISNYDIKDLAFDELKEHSSIIENDINVSYLPNDAPLASQKLVHGANKLKWSSKKYLVGLNMIIKTLTRVYVNQCLKHTYQVLKCWWKIINRQEGIKVKKN